MHNEVAIDVRRAKTPAGIPARTAVAVDATTRVYKTRMAVVDVRRAPPAGIPKYNVVAVNITIVVCTIHIVDAVDEVRRAFINILI